jgi:putative spermidine/putrescine transport system substrate-binding protein
MTTRLLIATLLLAAMPVVGAAQTRPEPPKPARIVVNDSGGAMQSAMRRFFYDDFEKRYGIKVVNTSPVDAGKLRAMVETGNVEWTVTEIGGEDAIRAERSGLLERLDLGIIDLSRFPQHLQKREYVFPKSVYSTVMGYRSDIFKEGARPRNWADFWDVKRFPGPRTMQNAPVDNLEFALLADGVPADKLYPLDVDRAFRKLDQLKKDVAVWWTTGAQSAQLLIDGEAVMGTAWNGRYQAPIVQGAPLAIEWTGGAIKESAFGIPRGAKDAYWGQKFLALAAEAEPQGRYADVIGYPGLNLDATRYTDPKMIPFLPTSPDNLARQFWTDLAWWADNGQAVKERWSRWMLRQ